MKKEQAYFYQVYKGLTIGFGMYEAIFMAYIRTVKADSTSVTAVPISEASESPLTSPK